MKNMIALSTAASIAIAAAPALAGNLSDPVVTPDVVAEAAVDDSMGNTDMLIVALAYILLLATVGGAF